jgi:hypothetical protein
LETDSKKAKKPLVELDISVRYGRLTEKPAPTYQGQAVGEVLKDLLTSGPISRTSSDISVSVDFGHKMVHLVRMRLLRSSSFVGAFGVITVVLRPLAVGFCHGHDQTFQFCPDDRLIGQRGQIIKLTLGYPEFKSETWHREKQSQEVKQAS